MELHIKSNSLLEAKAREHCKSSSLSPIQTVNVRPERGEGNLRRSKIWS